MKKAAEAIDAANKALQEAYEKLADCAKEADKLASKLGGEGGSSNNPLPETTGLNGDLIARDNSIGGLISVLIGGYDHGASQETLDKTIQSLFAATGNSEKIFTADMMKKIYEQDSPAYRQLTDFLGLSSKDMLNYGLAAVKASSKMKLLTGPSRFADGGLVNYTGPAWVDGSYSKPEAFLSAEDTARIGEAAKILADIPWLDGKNFSQSITNNRGGDVAVEINLNIDKLSSDVDVDSMIERVRQEIVEVSRPIGSPTILQQN
jgi:hypothetical protein